MDKSESELALADAEHAAGLRLDKVAIGLSVVCLVHCLALPVLVLAAPAVGALVLGTESPVHWLLLGLALPVSGYALWHGFRHHHQRLALLLGCCGLALMFVAVAHLTAATLELPLTVAGVLVLLAAHLLNLRFTAHCAHAH